MILYELSELTTQLPAQGLGLPGAPDPAPADFRGIAIHWWTYDLPKKNPERKLAPTVPIRQWTWFGVQFTAVTLDHSDTPPATTMQRDKYIQHAVAIVEAHHTLPQPKTVAWEIKDGGRSAPVYVSAMAYIRTTGVAAWPV